MPVTSQSDIDVRETQPLILAGISPTSEMDLFDKMERDFQIWDYVPNQQKVADYEM